MSWRKLHIGVAASLTAKEVDDCAEVDGLRDQIAELYLRTTPAHRPITTPRDHTPEISGGRNLTVANLRLGEL